MAARWTDRLIGGARSLRAFLADIVAARRVIVSLARNDFRSRYLASQLGLVWAFVQPVATLFILWFIFTHGFKSVVKTPDGRDLPFVLWLMPALVMWNFIGDGLSYATTAITGNVFLVKKTALRLSFLPVVRVLSAGLVHLIFLGIMAGVFVASGRYPHLYWLQAPYYLLAAFGLLFGVGWALAAVSVFIRDVENAVGVALQFGFWLTPVFWDPGMIASPSVRFLLKLNPAYYLTQGYRDCFVNRMWFWERPLFTAYFWAAVAVLFVAGAVLFRRLRPNFADVL